MIDPTPADVGRKVVYRIPGSSLLDEGVITRVDTKWIFVRFGNDSAAKATLRESLDWTSERPK